MELLWLNYLAYSTMHRFEYSLKVFKFPSFLQSGMAQDQLRCSVAALSLLWMWSLLLLYIEKSHLPRTQGPPVAQGDFGLRRGAGPPAKPRTLGSTESPVPHAAKPRLRHLVRTQESRSTLTHDGQTPDTWEREAGELPSGAPTQSRQERGKREDAAPSCTRRRDGPRPTWSPFEGGRSRPADANVSPGRPTRKPPQGPSLRRRAARDRNQRSAQDSPQPAAPAMTTSGSWAGRSPEVPLPVLSAIPPSCHVLTLSTARPRGRTIKEKTGTGNDAGPFAAP